MYIYEYEEAGFYKEELSAPGWSPGAHVHGRHGTLHGPEGMHVRLVKAKVPEQEYLVCIQWYKQVVRSQNTSWLLNVQSCT